MRIGRRLALFACLLMVLLLLAWPLSKSRNWQAFGDLSSRVETDQRLIALSFDDGPHPQAVAWLLPELEQRGVKATFFLTGAEIKRHPEAAAALVAAGHELGNHSYSHPRMVFMSPSRVAAEIERTDALIRTAGQAGDIHFRPPYGIKALSLPWFLARTGRRTIMWSIEPDSDSRMAASSAAITGHTIAHARPGDIILLHVMYRNRRTSREAVPAIIDGLQAQGYRFVTVSELLAQGPAD
jgi:peptidoglycan/xylan/chitin deacetylase (PgdA/CDA1 family)